MNENQFLKYYIRADKGCAGDQTGEAKCENGKLSFSLIWDGYRKNVSYDSRSKTFFGPGWNRRFEKQMVKWPLADALIKITEENILNYCQNDRIECEKLNSVNASVKSIFKNLTEDEFLKMYEKSGKIIKSTGFTKFHILRAYITDFALEKHIDYSQGQISYISTTQSPAEAGNILNGSSRWIIRRNVNWDRVDALVMKHASFKSANSDNKVSISDLSEAKFVDAKTFGSLKIDRTWFTYSETNIYNYQVHKRFDKRRSDPNDHGQSAHMKEIYATRNYEWQGLIIKPYFRGLKARGNGKRPRGGKWIIFNKRADFRLKILNDDIKIFPNKILRERERSWMITDGSGILIEISESAGGSGHASDVYETNPLLKRIYTSIRQSGSGKTYSSESLLYVPSGFKDWIIKDKNKICF